MWNGGRCLTDEHRRHSKRQNEMCSTVKPTKTQEGAGSRGYSPEEGGFKVCLVRLNLTEDKGKIKGFRR